jgi:diadenosine tetraphosphatase ApaH/serine/threonine PP2A family protein phosphatase
VLEKLDISDFSAGAAAAAEWTKKHITKESLDYLRPLEPLDGTQAVGLYHASPRDPVWEYVLSSWQAELCFEEMGPRVGAIGHSHVALYFHQSERGSATGAQVPGGTKLDISADRWLLNPGSAGQPRDGDPRAAWLLLDLQSWMAEWRRVEYPIEVAAKAIEEAGLPSTLAERLYVGQ